MPTLQQKPSKRLSGRLSGRIPPSSFSQFTTDPTIQIGSPHLPPPVVVEDPAQLQPPTVAERARGLIRLNTLSGQFNLMTLLGVILAVLAMTAAYYAMGKTADNFQRVIIQSSPSIIAANQLGQALNQLDTDAADVLITSSPAYATQFRNQQSAANADFATARQLLDDNLLKAYANVTFDGEEPTIKAIASELHDYLAQIEIMRYELSQGRREEALAAYKKAHDLVIGNPTHAALPQGRTAEELLKQNDWSGLNTRQTYQGIEANVAKLFKINQNALDSARSNVKADTQLSLILVVIAGILLVGALAGLVLRYAIVTHRFVNLGYVAALIAATTMLILLIIALSHASDDFETVSYTSFFSVNSASRAKQALRDFNGDESRLLLSPAYLGLDQNSPVLTPEVKQAFSFDLMQQNFQYKKNQVLSRVADAWSNVTYDGERRALCQVADITRFNPIYPLQNARCGAADGLKTSSNGQPDFALTTYFGLHDNLISLVQQGKVSDAIAISYGPSNGAAARALNGLEQLALVNEAYFNEASCATIGRGHFENGQFMAGDCAGHAFGGYLNLLQGLSPFIFTALAISIIGGAWLSRELF